MRRVAGGGGRERMPVVTSFESFELGTVEDLVPGSSEYLVCLRSPGLAQVPGCVPEGFLGCPRLSSEVLTWIVPFLTPSWSLSLTPRQSGQPASCLEPPSPALEAAH